MCTKTSCHSEKPEQHSQISLKIMGKHGQTRKNTEKNLGDQSWLPQKKSFLMPIFRQTQIWCRKKTWMAGLRGWGFTGKHQSVASLVLYASTFSNRSFTSPQITSEVHQNLLSHVLSLHRLCQNTPQKNCHSSTRKSTKFGSTPGHDLSSFVLFKLPSLFHQQIPYFHYLSSQKATENLALQLCHSHHQLRSFSDFKSSRISASICSTASPSDPEVRP